MKKTNQKGITLIALVITIIVLIILAGISINLLMGDNGIIKKAQDAGTAQEKAEIIEKVQLDIAEKQIDRNGSIYISDIEIILDNYGDVIKSGDDITGLKPDGKDYTIDYNKLYSGTISNSTPNNEENNVTKYYLFKDGNEYTDLTGGWDLSYPGYIDSPNWVKEQNNTVLHGGRYVLSDNHSQGSGFVTNRSINLAEYSRIGIKMEIVADDYTVDSIYGEVDFGAVKVSGWDDSRRWGLNTESKFFRDNASFGPGLKTYTFDIKGREKTNAYIYITGNNNPPMGEVGTVTNIDVYIYEIWLEK